MVRSREDAVKAARASQTNIPGTCQMWTRQMFDAPSVGDRDGDGDADAVDGWKSEPSQFKHPGDRKPPRGVPVAWSGGGNGFGHRAISLGPDDDGVYWIRTTDGNGEGRVANRPLRWVEDNWGLTYLGWSESISGFVIPQEDKAPKPKTRGYRVDRALDELDKAKQGPGRARFIQRAKAALKRIKFL